MCYASIISEEIIKSKLMYVPRASRDMDLQDSATLGSFGDSISVSVLSIEITFEEDLVLETVCFFSNLSLSLSLFLFERKRKFIEKNVMTRKQYR